MNELLEHPLDTPTESVRDIVFSPLLTQQITVIAELMASGRSTVPQHLQKSEGDCFAVVMQAMQWQMNPFAVAQKTHLINGTLGYESQLVNAVVSSSKAIKGRFKYEYSGDWSKHNIKGSDAAIRAGATLAGDDEITWGEWLFVGDVSTKNSPLWKSAPKQQAAYLAVKYWARLYCPEVILGVYSPDELETLPPQEKEINPVGNPPASRNEAIKQKVQAAEQTKAKMTLDAVLTEIQQAKSNEELAATSQLTESLSDDEKQIARQGYKERKALLNAK